MALSNITVKGLTPDLSVLGAYQRFHFSDDPVVKIQLFNDFVPPSILTDSVSNIELRNNIFCGYRFNHTTHFDELFYPGTFKFQYFINDGAGTDIWTYSGAYFTFNVPIQLQPFEGDLDMGGYKIINLATPILATDAANKAYVDSRVGAGTVTLTGHVTGSGTVGTPFATTFTLRLDQIAAPTTSLNLSNQKIINLAAPTLTTDAATKAYVDGKTWTVSQITNFNSSVTAFRLDQFAVPTANISMGNFKIINLALPSLPGDAVSKSYVDNLSPILDTNYVIPSSSFQYFNYQASYNDSEFRLANGFVQTVSTPSNMTLSLANSQGYGYRFNHLTTYTARPYGVLNLQSFALGTATTLLSVDSSKFLFSLNIDMGSSVKVVNLPLPTNGNDAANKTYVDNKFIAGSVVLTGDVTGSGTIGTPFITNLALRLDQIVAPALTVNLNNQKIINLAAPTLAADGANKTYVDSKVSAGTVTLTGDVTGSGTIGVPFATTFTLRLDQIAIPTASLNLNSQSIYNTINVGVGIISPHGRIHIDNTFENRKIILYEFANNNYQFQGFGTAANLLTYNVDATSSDHVWYAGTSASTRSELLRARGTGAVIVAGAGTLYGFRPFGCAYMQSNATYSGLLANTWTKVAGTTTLQSSTAKQFTMPLSNRLTYGGEQTTTSMIHVSGNAGTSTGSATTSFSIFKNGVQIIPSTINFTMDSTAQSSFSFSCPVSLSANDYIEVWHKTSINSTFTVNDMIFSVTTA